MASTSEKRKFERFPIRASIHIKDIGRRCRAITYSDDLSEGGLAFYSIAEIAQGSQLEISIGVRGYLFKIDGISVYCRNHPDLRFFRTGVEFKDSSSAFKAKLAEEAVLIKAYQKEIIQKTHHPISEEEAALDWIEKNAAHFSKIISLKR
jgi:hypothetical protein